MSDIIRVLLADDHPALRLGLRILLDQAPDVEVVGETGGGEAALVLIQTLQPDVVVLDCQLPGMEGIEVAQEIARRRLPVRVLALSAYDDERYVRGMIEAGAIGYLLKEEAPGAILAAVRAAVIGEAYFSPRVAAKIATWMRGERPARLTEREAEVLRLVAKGLSNKEIAQSLAVKERTVEFHMGNILSKLRVASRLEAAMWAKEQGMAS